MKCVLDWLCNTAYRTYAPVYWLFRHHFPVGY
jgi:hypothetical protein